jgi:poly(3-hydroxybutyrate) depolymerase
MGKVGYYHLPMRNLFCLFLFFFSLRASSQPVTVSGISSGAYMAQQFHTAFSSEVSGVGIIAGGPFYCARGNLIDALNRCMKTTLGSPKIENSLRESQVLAARGLIDPLENLKSSRVYILSGTHDGTVSPQINKLNIEVYQGWGVRSENIFSDFSIPAGHTMPTDQFGNKCEEASLSPWISNCGRDVAGEILIHLLGPLKNRSLPQESRLFSFRQLTESPEKNFDRLSMHQKAYAYIPKGCEKERCPVHIAFHGCQQTLDDIGEIFVKNSGYNAWAESNHIVILYPQAKRSRLINNPNGCWDWWGYSGKEYHTKEGAQMKLVHSLLKAWQEGRLILDKDR